MVVKGDFNWCETVDKTFFLSSFPTMLIEELTHYLNELLGIVHSLQGAIANIETHAAISNSNLGKSEEEVQLTNSHFFLLADVPFPISKILFVAEVSL